MKLFLLEVMTIWSTYKPQRTEENEGIFPLRNAISSIPAVYQGIVVLGEDGRICTQLMLFQDNCSGSSWQGRLYPALRQLVERFFWER
jgi:hypothetical protein